MISPSLVQAYEQSSYEVQVPGKDLHLQIGTHNKQLDELLQQHGAVQCAFITADNPGSVKCTEEENEARHHALISEIEKLGYNYYPGKGIPQDDKWQPEISVLIVGIEEADAIALAKRYGQIAILIGEVGKPVELRFCTEAA